MTLNFLDKFLDKITMYRLMLYFLIALVGISVIYSFLGIISFSPFSIIFSALFLVLTGLLSNKIFSFVLKAPANAESVYISALILCLIITPIQTFNEIIFLGFAAILAMSSKYILAIKQKHIFNPAAIAVVLTGITGQYASWWVGSIWMMPIVVAGGLLIVRKMQRTDLSLSFLSTVAIFLLGFTYLIKGDFVNSLNTIFLHSPLFFFAFVMLTEPSTTPPEKTKRIIYGILIGILFISQINIAGIFVTPELALVVGNVFSYLVSSKERLTLLLVNKMQVGADIIDFTFQLNKKFNFLPGQYLEWTLSHKKSDTRGNRRYFTIASSPTENNLRLGVKFYKNGSSFKKALESLDKKTPIIGSQLAGNFVLPEDKNKKLVFIAGGIGITPFRSIIKYLLDKNEKRDIVLLYSNKKSAEIMYKDIFDLGRKNLGIKTVYTLTESKLGGWKGNKGRINVKMIEKEIPDWKNRTFYLSGPHSMVKAFEQVLKSMEIGSSKIKIDFFPGYV